MATLAFSSEHPWTRRCRRSVRRTTFAIPLNCRRRSEYRPVTENRRTCSAGRRLRPITLQNTEALLAPSLLQRIVDVLRGRSLGRQRGGPGGAPTNGPDPRRIPRSRALGVVGCDSAPVLLGAVRELAVP